MLSIVIDNSQDEESSQVRTRCSETRSASSSHGWTPKQHLPAVDVVTWRGVWRRNDVTAGGSNGGVWSY